MQAFGEPGQRTFRVLAETAEGTISLWLEKEQVVRLGYYINELLERVPVGQGDAPESDARRGFAGELEVRVGSLTIGFDADHGGFALEATDFTSAFDLTAISLLASRNQLKEMADHIEEIVAASRPRCVLCGTPLSGDSHFCPESNGHARPAMAD